MKMEYGHPVGDTNYSTGLSLAGHGLEKEGTMIGVKFKIFLTSQQRS